MKLFLTFVGVFAMILVLAAGAKMQLTQYQAARRIMSGECCPCSAR